MYSSPHGSFNLILRQIVGCFFQITGLSSCHVSLQNPDSKMMQINLTGFLNGKNAREFMGELWPLLLSAQENIAGIPTAFLELKKEEIKQRQVGFHYRIVGELRALCRIRGSAGTAAIDSGLGSAELFV